MMMVVIVVTAEAMLAVMVVVIVMVFRAMTMRARRRARRVMMVMIVVIIMMLRSMPVRRRSTRMMMVVVVIIVVLRGFRGVFAMMMVVIMIVVLAGQRRGARPRGDARVIVHQERVGDGAVVVQNRFFNLRAQMLDFACEILRRRQPGVSLGARQARNARRPHALESERRGGKEQKQRKSSQSER